MDNIITKDELDKINQEIELIKANFIIFASRKDLKGCQKCADKLGKLTKRVKKYEKYLKESGEMIDEE